MKLNYLLLLLAMGTPLAGAFRAGAAYRVITPDVGPASSAVYIAGFGQNRVATAVHDQLFVRCLAMSTGQKPVVLCGVDLIGLFLDDVEKIREGARKQVGRDLDVIVAATHGHEGPDTMGLWGPSNFKSGVDPEYMKTIEAKVVESITDRKSVV